MNYIYFKDIKNEVFTLNGDNRKWVKIGKNKMIAVVLTSSGVICYGKVIYIGNMVRCKLQMWRGGNI